MIDAQGISLLGVRLNGRRIGIISRVSGNQVAFSFDEDYIEDANRPILSLSYLKQPARELNTRVRPYTLRLPPFFSNLLPEGHLRAYLAARAGVKSDREFALLAVLGPDLPGALTVEPLETEEHRGRADTAVAGADHALHFSLAGVQLKFSSIVEAKGGLTIPANGMGGSWIVKLPSNELPAVPENEYTMLALARAAGMTVPPNRLIDVTDIHGLPPDIGTVKGKALAIERFDRAADGTRIHMEDFAQVFGRYPDKKYEQASYANIAAVLWAEAGEPGTFEFVRRLAFSVLIGNADMHLKNWTLLYHDGRTPALSPAYDLVATLPYIPGDELALSFGGSKDLSRITADQVRAFSDTAHLPTSAVGQHIVDTAERTVEAWKALPEKDLLPDDLRRVVEDHITSVARSVSWRGSPQFGAS